MLDAILTPGQRQVRAEMRAFVKSVPRQLILEMDADRVRYPRDYVEEAARRNLLGPENGAAADAAEAENEDEKATM